MKKILLLIAFFSPFAIYSYNGDIQNFIIDENSICLNAPAVASKSYISEVSKVSKNAIWQAEISLSFSPTSSNFNLNYISPLLPGWKNVRMKITIEKFPKESCSCPISC